MLNFCVRSLHAMMSVTGSRPKDDTHVYLVMM